MPSKIKSLVCLSSLLILSPIISQETVIPQNSDSDISVKETDSEKLPNILQLRLDFINSDIENNEIYRLAGFYFSSKAYGKAAELYGQFVSLEKENPRQKAFAHYNRALALFSMKNYKESTPEFENAYKHNDTLYDALRMLGTVSFIHQKKSDTITYWKQYLTVNTNLSPERTAIENALAKIDTPEFSFEKPGKTDIDQSTTNLWPFSTPDTIPYPDAGYFKKRII